MFELISKFFWTQRAGHGFLFDICQWKIVERNERTDKEIVGLPLTKCAYAQR